MITYIQLMSQIFSWIGDTLPFYNLYKLLVLLLSFQTKKTGDRKLSLLTTTTFRIVLWYELYKLQVAFSWYGLWERRYSLVTFRTKGSCHLLLSISGTEVTNSYRMSL
jgi:hypothetical protein